MDLGKVTLLKADVDEVRSGGLGLEMIWGVVDSPLGKVLIARCHQGVRYLSFPDGDAETAIREEWNEASLTEDVDVISSLAEKIFSSEEDAIQVIVKGTAMQLEVWRALLSIPKGTLCTYGEVAEMIGRPKAVRAVGTAIGRNPISYLIPCHRVVRKSGALGGYRWGLEVKKKLIARESASLSV